MPRSGTIGLVRPSHPLLENLAHILSDGLVRHGYRCLRLRHTADFPGDLRLAVVFGPPHTIADLRPVLDDLKAAAVPVMFWLIEPIPPAMPAGVARAAAAVFDAAQRRAGLYRIGFVRKLARRRAGAQLSRHMPSHGALRDELWLSYICRNYTLLLDLFAAGLIRDVMVSLRYRRDVLAAAGIASVYAPMGYHRDWGYRQGGGERDLDVVFLGHVTRERKATLDEVAGALERHGRHLEIVSADCFGERRTELLNRTKILLTVLKTPWEFPGMRMLMGLGCGALVVSETADDPHPYEAGRHFVMTARDRLADTLLYYLERDDERRRIAAQGYDFVSGTLTMDRTVIPEIARAARTGA